MTLDERISSLKDKIRHLDEEIQKGAGYPCAVNKVILQEELDELLETKKKMSILIPLNTPENKKIEEYHRAEKLSEIFDRVGGGYLDITINVEDALDGKVVNAFFVKRDLQKNNGDPLPDGGTLDIQATRDDFSLVMCEYQGEIDFSGIPEAVDERILNIIGRRNFGYVTRQRKNKDEEDDSVEKVEIRLMAGTCIEAKDNQYTRDIILVQISPDGKIEYRNFASESTEMHNLLIQDCNEKSALAVLMLRDICKQINDKRK